MLYGSAVYGGVSVWARYCGVEVDWEAGGGGGEAVRGVAGFGSVFQVGGEAALEQFRVDPRAKLYILIFSRRQKIKQQ